MSHHLNAGTENGQRALDIPTAALFALVTVTASSRCRSLATSMAIRGWTGPWAASSISSADWESPWGITG